jgi:hypothetical protein
MLQFQWTLMSKTLNSCLGIASRIETLKVTLVASSAIVTAMFDVIAGSKKRSNYRHIKSKTRK